MSLKYKDFAPFFKSIDNYKFYPNDRITADKIILWDGSILEGNVTLYINDARIGYTKIKNNQRRMTYPCSQISYRTKINIVKEKILMLAGAIVPPGKVPFAAISDSIKLASGYNFGTDRSIKRSINRSLLRDNNDAIPLSKEFTDMPNILMPVDGSLNFGLNDSVVSNGVAVINTVGLGIRKEIEEKDKKIAGTKASLTLEGNTVKYQDIGAKYKICTITQTTTNTTNYRGGSECCDDCPGDTETSFDVDTLNETLNITKMGGVEIPRNGILDVSDGDYITYTYSTDANIWGFTSDGQMTLYYYKSTNSVTIRTRGNVFFYLDTNIIRTKELNFAKDPVEQTVEKFSNKLYAVNNAVITLSLSNSLGHVDSIYGSISFGNLTTNDTYTITGNYDELALTNDFMINYTLYPAGWRFDFLSLDAKIILGNPIIVINGIFNFFGAMMSEKFAIYSLKVTSNNYNIKYVQPTPIFFGSSGTINDVTEVNIDRIDILDEANVTIKGGSAMLKDELENAFSIGPENINIEYNFKDCLLVGRGGGVECNGGTSIKNNDKTANMYVNYMGNTYPIAPDGTYQSAITIYY